MCSSVVAQSQITADRPGSSTGTSIVLPERLIVETGLYYQNQNNSIETFSYNNTTLRCGMMKDIEFRISSDYIKLGNVTGFMPFTIGLKTLIYNGVDAIPAISILFNLKLPILAKKEFSVENLNPSTFLLMNSKLNDKFNLLLNLGIIGDDKNFMETKFLSLNLSYAISNTFGVYVENYNYFSMYNPNQSAFSTGTTFLIKKNTQLDASLNCDVLKPSKLYSFSLGVSHLF